MIHLINPTNQGDFAQDVSVDESVGSEGVSDFSDVILDGVDNPIVCINLLELGEDGQKKPPVPLPQP
jgi:hypothetical protein